MQQLPLKNITFGIDPVVIHTVKIYKKDIPEKKQYGFGSTSVTVETFSWNGLKWTMSFLVYRN